MPIFDARPTGRDLPARLSALAAGASALAFLDPRVGTGATVAVGVLVGGALLVSAWRRFSSRWATALLAFAVLASLARFVEPVFRGDAPSYYVYLRSLAFDHDLDFTNEWERFGYPAAARTPTGLQSNFHTIGPALLWCPFLLVGHAYVRALRLFGDTTWAADGMSVPYLRAAALGTLAWTVAGGFALVGALTRLVSTRVALVAAAAVFLATPWAYYVLRLPWVGHSLAFALSALALWAWLRADAFPSVRSWAVLGACVGALALCRPQTLAASCALVAPLAIAQVAKRRIGTTALGIAALAAVAAFSPQMLAWKALYGLALTMPMGTSFMDFRSPNFVNVLVSSDRGYFSWTPLAVFAVLGLLLAARRHTLLALSVALAILATAWVNGSVLGVHGPEWAGADAFGARRFDVAFPLLAVGIAALIERLVARPLVAPAAALGALVAWNLGLAASYEANVFPDGPAPLERVALSQARWVRQVTDRALSAIAGPRGAALAYKLFVGEYLYYNLALDGTIDLADEGSARFLEGRGWSAIRKRGDVRPFRWALAPRACLRLPFEQPMDLRASLLARRAPGATPRTFTVLVNDAAVFEGPLEADWSDSRFLLPASAMRPGENHICFAFSGGEDEQAAAAIARLQLP